MTNHFSDVFTVQSRGVTPEGLPCVMVRRNCDDRETIYNCDDRETVYFLIQRETPSGLKWYSTGPQQISNGVVRFLPEANGVRLSDSRLDQTLKAYAEDIA